MEGEVKISAPEGAYTMTMTRTKPLSPLVLISFALVLCGFTSLVLSDDVQLSDELPNLFFDDGSTFATSPELEAYDGPTTDLANPDLLLANESDDKCEIGNSQLFNRKGKRAHEECKMQPSILRSPINLPHLPQLSTDPLNVQDPKKGPEPNPDDWSFVYPFELPPDNNKICPQPDSMRLYAVCDSGIRTDNKWDEVWNSFNLRYCTLYNSILGCEDPHELWCCEYYYLDTLAVELGIIEEGVGVGRYCKPASFFIYNGLPVFPW